MGKATKAAPNEIATSSNGREFKLEVGDNLEKMRDLFRDDTIFHCAKAGMQTQAHSALEASLKKHKNETVKALAEMKQWTPGLGRQKINPLVKYLSGLSAEDAKHELAIVTEMFNGSPES